MSRMRTAAATDTGYLRASNQDVALATSDLAAVADGMGGHLGGEVAARIAVEHLLDAYRRDRTTDGLIAAVVAANSAVYSRSKSDRNLRGMGTTLTAAAFMGDKPDGKAQLALVNVGDSRGYLLDRAERRVHKLTEDHSVVEEMVRSGELTTEEAAVHPHRHILTRALGIEPSIEPDCWELDLEPGSRLLLCSDGLTNELDEQEIANVLLDEADAEKAASELVRLALYRGGIDNVTVVVLDVLSGEAPAETDDVVVIPVGATASHSGGTGKEIAPITEAVALTPPVEATAAAEAYAAVAGATGAGATREPDALAFEETDPPAAVQESLAVPLTKSPPVVQGAPLSGAAPRGPHGRPMVLVRKGKDRRREHRDRIFTIRVALFVLVFVAVLGSTAGVVVWFDKASFYVGLDQGHVTIFQGRPGGLLWFKPSVVERTTITPAELLSSNVDYLKQGMEESSYQAALNLVHSLALEHTVIVPSESTTTTSAHATATTVPTKGTG
jgi:serine/threonine protein phosphatase PrpC